MTEQEQSKARSAPLRNRPYGRVYGVVWHPAERVWSVLMHLSAFLCPFVLPVFIWLVLRDKSDMLDYHGRRAFNFHGSFLLYELTLSAVLAYAYGIGARPGVEQSELGSAFFIFIVALIFLIIVSIIWVVWTIDAAIHAWRGDAPGYILAIPFLR